MASSFSFFVAVCAFSASASCGQVTAAASAASVNSQSDQSIQTLYSRVMAASLEQREAGIASLKGESLNGYAARLLRSVDNRQVVIGGVSMSGLHDRLAAVLPALAALEQDHPTLGAYWQSQGLAVEANVSMAQLEAGLNAEAHGSGLGLIDPVIGGGIGMAVGFAAGIPCVTGALICCSFQSKLRQDIADAEAKARSRIEMQQMPAVQTCQTFDPRTHATSTAVLLNAPNVDAFTREYGGAAMLAKVGETSATSSAGATNAQ